MYYNCYCLLPKPMTGRLAAAAFREINPNLGQTI